MIGIKINKNSAERIKRYLKAHKLIDKQHNVYGKNDFIYFPIKPVDSTERRDVKSIGGTIGNFEFETQSTQSDYRQKLQKELGRRYEEVQKGYDVLGNIAIIDAEKKDARKVAKVVMGINKSVTTVLNKEGAVKGLYRIRGYSYVAGKRSYMATYKENGITLRFDVRKTFFSSRLSFERNRISKAMRNGETLVSMFAGVGPFAIVAAKAKPKSRGIAIELNRAAYKYLVENIKLNRLKNVVSVLGDVNKVAAKYKNTADRIVMPLPKDTYSFLDAIMTVAKRPCTVHFYTFSEIDDPYAPHIRRLGSFFKSHKRSFRVVNKRIVRPYSAREVEIVLDFVIR